MSLLTQQRIFVEAAAVPGAFADLADSGDHTIFTATAKPWSRFDSEPVYGGYGIVTGGAGAPAASGTENLVDVAAVEVFAPGMTGANPATGKVTVAAATDLACTRGVTNGFIVNSVTVTNAGTFAVVAGTEGAAFSSVRGAAGGPPFIPVDSIEVFQVRLTDTDAAVVLATEIYAVPGTHQERYDTPAFTPDYLRGKLTFSSPLPLIHTGGKAKKVYARVSTPDYMAVPDGKDWVPAEASDSVTSDTNYDRTIAASISSTLSAASFSAAMGDGVTDAILRLAGKCVIVKFMPNRNGTAYQLTQGYLSYTRTFGVKSNPTGSFTLAPEQASIDFAS